MSLSLSKYVENKANLKFGQIWFKTSDNALCYVHAVQSYPKDNGWDHKFHCYFFPDDFPSGADLSYIKHCWNDMSIFSGEGFEDLWENSISFPKEGMRNIYDPVTKEFWATLNLFYDPNVGHAKYKRAANYDAYQKRLETSFGGPFEKLLNELSADSYNWNAMDFLKKKLRSLELAISAWKVAQMNALFNPRYDFVNWRDHDDINKFFQTNKQVMVSPILRVANHMGCLLLLNANTPIAVLGYNGFMIKESAANLYEKDLLKADLPFLVVKRLIRSNTFILR